MNYSDVAVTSQRRTTVFIKTGESSLTPSPHRSCLIKLTSTQMFISTLDFVTTQRAVHFFGVACQVSYHQ